MEAALCGRWAVVTGGSGGIGRAMAIALHDRGMRVVVGDINPPVSEAPLPSSVRYIQTDVRDPAQLERLADATGGEPPAVWVNNAGIAVEVGDQLLLRSSTAKAWRTLVDINFKAVIEGSQIAIHRNLAWRAAGHLALPCFVISTASASGLTPRAAAAYSSAKAGVIHFTRSIVEGLRQEHVEDVYCFALCPTYTDTPMMRELSGQRLIERSTSNGSIAPAASIANGMLHFIDAARSTPNGAVMRFDTRKGKTVASLVRMEDAPVLRVVPLGRSSSADTSQRQCQPGDFQVITEATDATTAPQGLDHGLKFVGNRICPFAHRNWWIANELRVPYEYVHVDFVTKPERGDLWVTNDKPEWYKQELSPMATIPTLLDEGVPIMAIKGCFENDVISEHLLSKYGSSSPLLPSLDPERQAKVRRLISRTSVVGAWSAMYRLLSNQDPAKDGALAEALWAKLRATNELFSEAHPDGPFFLGAEPSLADVAIVPFLDRFSSTLAHFRGFDLLPEGASGVSRLRAMLGAARSRDEFRTTSQRALRI